MAVISSLPMLASTTAAKGAVMGMAATNGASGQTTGAVAFLKGLGGFAAMVALPAALGGYFGRKLGGDSVGGMGQRQVTAGFWRVFSAGFALLILLPFLLLFTVTPFLKNEVRSTVLSILTVWLGLAYPFVIGALLYWGIRRRKHVPAAAQHEHAESHVVGKVRGTRLPRMVVGAVTAAAVGFLVFCYADMNHNVGHPPPDELRRIISEASPGDLKASILVSHLRSIWGKSDSTRRSLWLELRRPEGISNYSINSDDAALALLKEKGVAVPAYVEGRDFAVLGTPGRFLPLLAAFVLGLGAVYLLSRRVRNRQESENE